eukprot:GHVN01031049.1.p1 GENE.GHVN01031049.1~~GHVN01031049.1.p1  ORF type:complete len:303 (+),score=77.68 GHVN01031049.1:255-1163(+)
MSPDSPVVGKDPAPTLVGARTRLPNSLQNSDSPHSSHTSHSRVDSEPRLSYAAARLSERANRPDASHLPISSHPKHSPNPSDASHSTVSAAAISAENQLKVGVLSDADVDCYVSSLLIDPPQRGCGMVYKCCFCPPWARFPSPPFAPHASEPPWEKKAITATSRGLYFIGLILVFMFICGADTVINRALVRLWVSDVFLLIFYFMLHLMLGVAYVTAACMPGYISPMPVPPLQYSSHSLQKVYSHHSTTPRPPNEPKGIYEKVKLIIASAKASEVRGLRDVSEVSEMSEVSEVSAGGWGRLE